MENRNVVFCFCHLTLDKHSNDRHVIIMQLLEKVSWKLMQKFNNNIYDAFSLMIIHEILKAFDQNLNLTLLFLVLGFFWYYRYDLDIFFVFLYKVSNCRQSVVANSKLVQTVQIFKVLGISFNGNDCDRICTVLIRY